MVRIDGAQGEGGGQILRTSLSLSALTGQKVEIYNIRAGRKRPGLAAQHASCCNAVAAVSGGTVDGVWLGAQTIRLSPGEISGGTYSFDVGALAPSAGSVALVLQSVLPVLSLAPAPSTVEIFGGTDVPWSPVFAYLKNTFCPALSRFGVSVLLERTRAGFYPQGKGRIVAHVTPCRRLSSVAFTERGHILNAVVSSTVSDSLPEHILRRQNENAAWVLEREGIEVECEEHYLPSASPGTSCVVSVSYENGYHGYTSLGQRGKPAEEVGVEAANCPFKVSMFSHPAVDEYLADQLLIYMAIAEGRSELGTQHVTTHLRTNALVARQIIGSSIEFGPSGGVTVQGACLQCTHGTAL